MTGNVGWGPSYEVVREPTTGQRRRAALAAAAHAVDATELSELLAMLGLSATDAHPDSGAIDGRAPHRSGTSPEVLAELAAFAALVQEEADRRGSDKGSGNGRN